MQQFTDDIEKYLEANDPDFANLKLIDRNKAPIPLHSGIVANSYPIESFPRDLYALTQEINRIVQAPISICAQSILAALSLIIQPHINIEVDGRISPVSLYFITIGESGIRKTAIDNIVINEIRDHERKKHQFYEYQYQQYKESLEKDKKQHQPKPTQPYILQSEPTYESLVKNLHEGQPSMGLFSDEGGRFIGGYGMNKDNKLKTAAGLSEFWDGKPITRSRVSEGMIKLYDRRLSFHLMIQPGIATQLLGDPVLIDQGFLSRCLIAQPESNMGIRNLIEESIYDSPIYQAYKKKMQAILALPYKMRASLTPELNPVAITLSKDARAYMKDFYLEVERELIVDGKYAEIKGFANKAVEHALRLAALFSFWNNIETKEVTNIEMISAIEVIRFYLNEACRLIRPNIDVRYTSNNENITFAQELLEWMQRYRMKSNNCMITMREIQQYASRKYRHNKELILKLINILISHGYIDQIDNKTWKLF